MNIKSIFFSFLVLLPLIIVQSNNANNVSGNVNNGSRFSRHIGTALAIGAAITFWSMHDQRQKKFILGIRNRKKLGAASLGCIVGSVALDEFFPKGQRSYKIKPVLQALLMGYGALGLKKAITDEQLNNQNRNQNRFWEINYNNIRLWQVLGAGGLINKYIAHLQGRKYSAEDLWNTGFCWLLLDI